MGTSLQHPWGAHLSVFCTTTGPSLRRSTSHAREKTRPHPLRPTLHFLWHPPPPLLFPCFIPRNPFSFYICHTAIIPLPSHTFSFFIASLTSHSHTCTHSLLSFSSSVAWQQIFDDDTITSVHLLPCFVTLRSPISSRAGPYTPVIRYPKGSQRRDCATIPLLFKFFRNSHESLYPQYHIQNIVIRPLHLPPPPAAFQTAQERHGGLSCVTPSNIRWFLFHSAAAQAELPLVSLPLWSSWGRFWTLAILASSCGCNSAIGTASMVHAWYLCVCYGALPSFFTSADQRSSRVGSRVWQCSCSYRMFVCSHARSKARTL